MKCKLILKNFTVPENLLPNHEKALLDGNPNAISHYTKEHKAKYGVIDLDYMLYRYVK